MNLALPLTREIIDAPKGPLYIIGKIKGNLSRGVLIGPICMVIVIAEEHLYIQQFYQDTYDKSDVMIKVHDGFICPTIGSIPLPIEVGTKCLDVTFAISPTSDQFRVKLGHPWLNSMKAIASTIHKCLKFPHNGCIMTINHSLCKPFARCGNFTLDCFWPQKPEPLKPREHIVLLSYQKFNMKGYRP